QRGYSVITSVPAPVPARVSRRRRSVITSAPEPVATPAADTSTETAVDNPPTTLEHPSSAIEPASNTVIAAVPLAPASRARATGLINVLAYAVAIALAGTAAYFSIRGMIVLFPGAPTAIVIMGVAMEAAKLITVAFLAHQWHLIGRLSGAVL